MIRGTHTPGNWSFDEGSGEVTSDIDEHGFVVCTVESNDADGPLLAAAPALLEACRATLAKLEKEGWDVGGAYRLALRKAIAKADGE